MAAGLHDDFGRRCALAPVLRHVGHLRRADAGLGQAHVFGIVKDRVQRSERRPVDHRDPLPRGPRASATADAVLERRLAAPAQDAELPEVHAPTFVRSYRSRLWGPFAAALAVVRADFELEPVGLALLDVRGEGDVSSPRRILASPPGLRSCRSTPGGGQRDVGEGREDLCQGRRHPVGEEAERQPRKRWWTLAAANEDRPPEAPRRRPPCSRGTLDPLRPPRGTSFR